MMSGNPQRDNEVAALSKIPVLERELAKERQARQKAETRIHELENPKPKTDKEPIRKSVPLPEIYGDIDIKNKKSDNISLVFIICFILGGLIGWLAIIFINQ